MLTKHNSGVGVGEKLPWAHNTGTHESKTCDDMQFKHVIDLIIVSTRSNDVKLVILACIF